MSTFRINTGTSGVDGRKRLFRVSSLLSCSRRAILVGAYLTAVSPSVAQSGSVRIRVTVANVAVVIPGAKVSLLGADGKPLRSVETDESGETLFTDLPIGDSRFVVSSPAFMSRLLTVTVRNSDEVRVDAQLEVTPGDIWPVRPRRRWWHIFR